MRQVVLTFEDAQYEKLLEACDLSSVKLGHELAKALALMAYGTNKISLGKAAEIAGISLWEMMELLRTMGLPVYQYDDEDWEVEQKAIDRIRKSR